MMRRPANLDQRALVGRESTALAIGFALASVPHLSRVPPWLAGLIGLLVLWRLFLARRNLEIPGKWLLGLIAFASAGGILIQYRTLFGRDAGVALLVVMLALKLLESRTLRDGMLMIFLGFFLLVTNFLFSQTITTGLYMLLCAWLIVAGLISLQFTGPWPGWRMPLQRSGMLLLQAAPLMLVLFLLFPRLQGPLWGLPHDAHSGLTGLSDNMSPGSLNNLIQSDAVAFRAAFVGRVPAVKDMYWRGPVLWDYDGQTWTAPRFTFNTIELPESKAGIEYTITLEPHNKRWLFALEFPLQRPPRSVITRDMQMLATAPVRSRMRYDMRSLAQDAYGADDSRAILDRNLQLPEGYNPKTLRHARELRQRFPDDRQLINHVLSSFRNENYVYTLSPPLLGRNAVDEFLFDTRRGFCEHYASAFTFLMRAAGIPARVVTGYQGGLVNPVGDYVLIRQADAHAWTEVWLRGSGWIRIDPTAAVSPARVERGIASALPSSDTLPLFVRGNYRFLQRLRLTFDSVTYAWNQWVLGYNPERQRLLLSRIGLSEATWQKLAILLVIFAGFAVLIGAVLALRELRAARIDAVRAAYERFCRKLARLGLSRHPAEGPRDFALRIAQWNPALGSAAHDITQQYVALRYGPEWSIEGMRTFEKSVRRFTKIIN